MGFIVNLFHLDTHEECRMIRILKVILNLITNQSALRGEVLIKLWLNLVLIRTDSEEHVQDEHILHLIHQQNNRETLQPCDLALQERFNLMLMWRLENPPRH